MDAELREQLAREVRAIIKEEEITALLVTHDQYEAFAMADEIGVLNAGQLMQWDSGYNLYHRPGNRFVADFIGQGVILPGEVLGEGRVQTELGVINGQLPPGCKAGCKLELLLRPDDIQHDDQSALHAKVVAKAFRGAEFLYTLELASGTRVLCFAPSHHDHPLGEQLGIRVEVDHLVMFPQPGADCERLTADCLADRLGRRDVFERHVTNLKFHFVQIAKNVGRFAADASGRARIETQGFSAFHVGNFFDARLVLVAVANQIVVAGERHGLGVVRVVHQENAPAMQGERTILSVIGHQAF